MNNSYESKRTRYLVLMALFTALVMATTMIFQIPTSFGYLNLGDLVIMILTTMLPVRTISLVAGMGSALADVFGGYPIYAAFTFFIKIIEVLILSFFLKSKDKWIGSIGFLVAGLSMVVLYGFADVILTTSFAALVPSILSNLPQGLICGFGAIALRPAYSKFNNLLKGFNNEPK